MGRLLKNVNKAKTNKGTIVYVTANLAKNSRLRFSVKKVFGETVRAYTTLYDIIDDYGQPMDDCCVEQGRPY